MMDELNALNAPKKVVDGLVEVFDGLAQMFAGVSEQRGDDAEIGNEQREAPDAEKPFEFPTRCLRDPRRNDRKYQVEADQHVEVPERSGRIIEIQDESGYVIGRIGCFGMSVGQIEERSDEAPQYQRPEDPAQPAAIESAGFEPDGE